MWLILGRSGVDVCMKDPGFAVDLTLRGNIRDYVDVYLGHTKWRDVAGTALQLDGDLQIARAFPVWLRLETVNGLNAPAPHLFAGPAGEPASGGLTQNLRDGWAPAARA
jgi:hypothetical protein